MSYVDHYELEIQRPGGNWEHVDSVYPLYQWTFQRPWYWLGLKRCVVLSNKATAKKQAQCALATLHEAIEENLGPNENVRVWEWRRGWCNRIRRRRLLFLFTLDARSIRRIFCVCNCRKCR